MLGLFLAGLASAQDYSTDANQLSQGSSVGQSSDYELVQVVQADGDQNQNQASADYSVVQPLEVLPDVTSGAGDWSCYE